jgi:hypothetical protein
MYNRIMAVNHAPIENSPDDNRPSTRRLRFLIIGAAASLALVVLLIGVAEVRAYLLFYLYGEWSLVLNRNLVFSTEPEIVAMGSNVYLTWIEEKGADDDLMFAKSPDNGKTFDKPIRLDDDTIDYPQGHQMVLDKQSGHIHVIWYSSNPQFSNGSYSFLYYTRSTDGGNTFEKFRLLSNDTSMQYREYAKIITSDGKFVNIFWSSSSFNLTQIRSIDSGTTFGKPVYLDRHSGRPDASVHQIDTVATENDLIHLLWSENWYSDDDDYGGRVYLRTSNDNGDTFGKPVLITDVGDTFSLVTTEGGRNVYVVWHNDPIFTSGDVVVRASTDGGATFGPIMNVSSNSEQSVSPNIAASTTAIEGNDVYLVWYDATDVTYDDNDKILSGRKDEIKFQRLSLIDGDRYELSGKLVNVTNTAAGWHGFGAHIAIGSNNTIHLMWRGFIDLNFLDGERQNDEVFYSKSDNGGTSFARPVNISMMLGNSRDAKIAVSGGNVYVVWVQEVPIGQQRAIEWEVFDSNILFKASADNGNTFGEPVMIS